jgi:hypothetical protein
MARVAVHAFILVNVTVTGGLDTPHPERSLGTSGSSRPPDWTPCGPVLVLAVAEGAATMSA